jgi:tetratricopeptide (TPR) repeat protein
MLGRPGDARLAFEAALAAEPGSPTVLALAARFFDTVHDTQRARALAEEAIRLSPENDVAHIALVEMALREKKYDVVVSRATPLLQPGAGLNLRNQARLSYLVATAHDRLGNYAQAFDFYVDANTAQAALDRDFARTVPSPLHDENLERIIRFLKSAGFGDWTTNDDPQGPAPVFLLGFVRSGTTWLDQILSSHPSITVMEEEDLLVDSWRDLLIDDAGLARLAALPADEINRRRAAYWERAGKALAGIDRRPVIVDKLPLNTANLPLIFRLFPEAKILFAVRDPRDAVFSAFQQHFQVNAGMAHFLDVTTAAQFYDRIMTIGEMTRRMAPMTVYEVRYERVVADFDGEIGRILDFLELPWSDDVRNYQETAKRRTVRTPSARQVIEKPFATSIGKWRRYRDGMAPALPILAPWVEKFGYEPD